DGAKHPPLFQRFDLFVFDLQRVITAATHAFNEPVAKHAVRGVSLRCSHAAHREPWTVQPKLVAFRVNLVVCAFGGITHCLETGSEICFVETHWRVSSNRSNQFSNSCTAYSSVGCGDT